MPYSFARGHRICSLEFTEHSVYPQMRCRSNCWGGYLFQRALAAFFATAVRCSAVMLSALALPPFRPPRRPRLTAAASFPSNDGSGSRSSTSPLAISIMSLASWAGSRGRFFKRFSSMIRICAKIRPVSRGFELRQFKRAHYPATSSFPAAPVPVRRRSSTASPITLIMTSG
jgi:hypothetical protein